LPLLLLLDAELRKGENFIARNNLFNSALLVCQSNRSKKDAFGKREFGREKAALWDIAAEIYNLPAAALNLCLCVRALDYFANETLRELLSALEHTLWSIKLIGSPGTLNISANKNIRIWCRASLEIASRQIICSVHTREEKNNSPATFA